MALEPERVPASVAVLLSVLLAAPSVMAPTWRLTTLDSERGVVLFDQQDWGWGRSQVLGAGGTVVQDLQNPFGLVLLVGLLALTAAGAAAWVVTTSPLASLAPVASATLLGRLATSVSERQGRAVRDDVHGLAATGSSTLVGALESLAAIVLCVAVVLMLLTLARWRMPSAWVVWQHRLTAGRRDNTVVDEPEATVSGNRSPSKIINRPVGKHLSGPAVGFDDPEREM